MRKHFQFSDEQSDLLLKKSISEFYDDGKRWFNYEDYLSQLAHPFGPGIAFFDDVPLRVFHCDRKLSAESAHYTRDLRVKLAEFERRSRQANS